jgi:hypothetical protein
MTLKAERGQPVATPVFLRRELNPIPVRRNVKVGLPSGVAWTISKERSRVDI